LKNITSSHSNMAEVGEEGGIWGAGARNYDNQAWGVTRQGDGGNHGHEKNNQGGGMGALVARHYDNLPEKGRESRQESRIYHMRSFNNWTKSMLINEYMDKIRRAEGFRGQVSVLDLGCGKGGDLTKWHKAKVDHVVGVDIAATSIEQCKDRYHEMKGRSKGKIFRAEFHAVDCTKQRARDFYKNSDQEFDLVSCQFAFHYCFESLPQADCMLRNASENLRKGGFFIGTTPDAHDIMARLETGKTGNSFGNSVFSVSFNEENVGKQQPLFGAEYNFHLTEVVDCPEFLVHFPTLVRLAERHGLMMIGKQRFQSFFQAKKDAQDGRMLLSRMNALETFPSRKTVGPEAQYEHAAQFKDGQEVVGTLSQDEWEALTIYTVFAFKKIR